MRRTDIPTDRTHRRCTPCSCPSVDGCTSSAKPISGAPRLSAVQFERLVQRNRRYVVDPDGAHLVDLISGSELGLDIGEAQYRHEVVDPGRLPGVFERS